MRHLIITYGKKGGAEGVMHDFASYLDEEGTKVDFYRFGSITSQGFRNYRRLVKFKTLLGLVLDKKYCVYYSTYRDINIIVGVLSFIRKDALFIFRESSIAETRSSKTRKFWYKKLIEFTYRNARIWVQSEDAKLIFHTYYKNSNSRVFVQGNWIKKDLINSLVRFPDTPNGILNLVIVTRKNKVKRHDLICEILNMFDRSINLHIFGEFDVSNVSNDLIKIVEYGFLDYWWRHLDYRNSFIYLQTSDVEGFPNAVLEALALNIPVVAMECLGGTLGLLDVGMGYYVKRNVTDAHDAIVKLHMRQFNCLYLSDFMTRYQRTKAIENVRISASI